MKNRKWLKILLVLLAVVIMGVVFSCQSNPAGSAEEETGPVLSEETEAAAEETHSKETKETTTETETTEKVCVHVCGSVNTPGVYYLEPGARIHEAVEAAGGLSRDAAEDYVNLAEVITDGAQIYIPSLFETENSTRENATETTSADDGKISLNTASEKDLTSLPGIGEAKAKAIIAYRKENGDFSDINDLKKVSGIGDGLFEQIKEYIKV